MIELLMVPEVQLGIFLIIVLTLVLNFIVKLSLIKAGIYKRVYKQRRIDWDKVKGGLIIMGFAGILLAANQNDWKFWVTILMMVIFIAFVQMIAGLFFSNRKWKNYKYWD